MCLECLLECVCAFDLDDVLCVCVVDLFCVCECVCLFDVCCWFMLWL